MKDCDAERVKVSKAQTGQVLDTPLSPPPRQSLPLATPSTSQGNSVIKQRGSECALTAAQVQQANLPVNISTRVSPFSPGAPA